ncbi:PP2C family protein-serine/threonine phosphatase [Streptomyces longisporoflavus]|uniref:PP2C family protein-serine/threonine phosphatase n=1 Tax=Streptomyces longisporoflavus TaxID=28044 RepID=UPI001E559626|nr:PP2C family protein-serine/threonine phosphatase [Streptomyces longisporoflavus]
MNAQHGRARSASPADLLMALTTVLLVSLDLAFHEQHRGIVVALAAIPALSLAVPAGRPSCRPLLVGGIALAGALVSAGVDWRDRPFVLLATFLNIVLVSLISHRLQPRLHLTTPSPATVCPAPLPVAAHTEATPERPPELTAQTYQIGDYQLALRSVPQANRTTLVADLCDARESPYGTRILVADLMGKDEATRIAGDELLEQWRQLAMTEPSLAEIARSLDTDLAQRTDRFAKALLITLHDGRGELVCCGHAPPLLLSDAGDVRELNVLTPVPPLGLFHLVPHGCAVYTTTFTVSAANRLLLHTDGIGSVLDAQGSPFPLHDRARAYEGRPPAALLEALVDDLIRHAGGDLQSLRDEALLLLLQAEKPRFRHITTALHSPPASNHTEARMYTGLGELVTSADRASPGGVRR